MSRLYYQSLISAAIICSLILVAYYFVSKPAESEILDVIETQYIEPEVAGPIQPIPTIDVIDKSWLRLGKALFNSKLLSKDNSISCASCHLVNFGGDDGFPVSTGINSKTGTRNSPTVLNAVFNFKQFWDGRSHSLEDQIEGPIHNPVEMGTNWKEVLHKLRQDEDFRQMFESVNPRGVTQEALVKAIAIYEQSLVTPNAPIDRYLLGDDKALDYRQKQGLAKFKEFGCITCHQGVNIGGNIYQKFGRLDNIPEGLRKDLGLYEHTGRPEDKHIFKVPSLRNVADTAPYFHDGSVKTLEQAVQTMAKVQLGRELSEEDVSDLVALLNAFSAKVQELE